MIRKEEFTFDSRDGKSKIHALRWVPEGKVICILQIVHGMAEHMERYDEVATYFAEKGILVTGEDYLGHGKSVSEGGCYGYFCEQDPATVVVRDVHRLKKITQEEYPGLPYIILGHSMGSYVLRNYMFRYGTGIQGAILCGTGFPQKVLVKTGLAVATVQGMVLGQKHIAKFIDKVSFGGYNKRIEAPKTKFDWLCSDEKLVDAYVKDPLCGFTFTVNGFRTTFTLINRLYQNKNLNQMPKELPVMFIAGANDPVGDYGEGVKKVYDDFKQLGMEKVCLKLYPKDRHEILNEPDKEAVYEDIYPWMMERIKEYQI